VRERVHLCDLKGHIGAGSEATHGRRDVQSGRDVQSVSSLLEQLEASRVDGADERTTEVVESASPLVFALGQNAVLELTRFRLQPLNFDREVLDHGPEIGLMTKGCRCSTYGFVWGSAGELGAKRLVALARLLELAGLGGQCGSLAFNQGEGSARKHTTT
jgi:hypothetical protein